MQHNSMQPMKFAWQEMSTEAEKLIEMSTDLSETSQRRGARTYKEAVVEQQLSFYPFFPRQGQNRVILAVTDYQGGTGRAW